MTQPTAARQQNIWPEPAKLVSPIPVVERLDVALLPRVFQPLVRDVAERMNVPLDMPAAAAIACLGACVNRRARIQPQKQDHKWQVVPCIWSAVVAEPGKLKTPTLSAVCRPLAHIEQRWREQYDEALAEYKPLEDKFKLDQQVYSETYKAWRKRGSTPPEPIPAGEPPVKPVCRRLIVNDTTHEKLHDLLSENPAGLFLQLDELTSWLASLDKPGREDARSFFLTCWSVSGDAVYTMDRVGRGTVTAKVCLSLLGGIQPDMLTNYLGSLSDSDGLLQRLQVLVWPESVPYKRVDRAPNEDALQKVEGAFQKLLDIDAEAPLQFKFDTRAQHAFNDWRDKLEAKLSSGKLLSAALVSHLSKYRSLMPALALLFELIDRKKSSNDFTVSLEHTRQSMAFCSYLESHAKKVYWHLAGKHTSEDAAYDLSKHIAKGVFGAKFKLRDVYRKHWRGLGTPAAAKSACDALVDAGWLRSKEVTEYGTVSVLYDVNPKVLVNEKVRN